MRFSTPVHEYREFDGLRLPAFAEARWQGAGVDFAYGEFRLREVSYTDSARR
jgi:hypothetical protein